MSGDQKTPEVVTRRPLRVLPDALANQIAAGEVVERPASVVKELIENALDAGATRLDIVVEAGGVKLIQVTDNGWGIPRHELSLALSAHATSKVAVLSDLVALGTLGFRGEALPSIASVSRFSMTSRVADAETGWLIEGAGGVVTQPPRPHASPIGTRVEVRDLFFNTPARRKFLRTEKTELRQIEDVIRRLALSRFDVVFRFRADTRSPWSLPIATEGEAKLRRVAKLSGSAFCHSALDIEFETDRMRLSGWLGLPSLERKQSDLQYFFVNGRAIRDRLITHAVRQAYEDRLMDGTHPAYVLYLEIPLDQVDVNVHPAKAEVRFSDARVVHDFISRSLRNALGETQGEETVEFVETPRRFGYLAASPPPAPDAVREQLDVYQRLYGDPSTRNEGHRETRRVHSSDIRRCGQFALVVDANEVCVVDLVAARRVVQAASLRRSEVEDNLPSRPLLLPARVKLSGRAIDQILGLQAIWQPLGIRFRSLGPEQLSLMEVPVAMTHVDGEKLLTALRALFVVDRGPPARNVVLEVLCAHESEQMVPDSQVETVRLVEALQALGDPAAIGEACKRLDQSALRSLVSDQ